MSRFILPTLLCACSVLWVFADQIPAYKGKYEAPEGFSVEGVGVCAPTDLDVVCWDMRGNPAPQLTELVRAKLLTDSNLLRLEFRKKNRILLAKASQGVSLSYSTGQGDYLPETNLNYDSEGPSLHLLSYSGDPAEHMMSVRATLRSFVKERVYEVPAQVGTKFTVDNSPIEFVSASQRKVAATRNSYDYQESSELKWEIRLKGKLQVDPETIVSPVEWLDSTGKSIQAVDKSGKPVRLTAGMQLRGPMYSEPSSFRFNPVSVGDATVYITNVNPRYLSLIRFRTSTSREVLITDFPLDPTEHLGL